MSGVTQRQTKKAAASKKSSTNKKNRSSKSSAAKRTTQNQSPKRKSASTKRKSTSAQQQTQTTTNDDKPKPGGKTKQSDSNTSGGSINQIGNIVEKGLDLAEAGLSLGLTLVTRVGSIAQETVDNIGKSATTRWQQPAPDSVQPPPTDTDTAQQHEHEPHSQAAAEVSPSDTQEQVYCVMNRLALHPGQTVNVSFSINNDSATQPKHIALDVEGFLGEITSTLFASKDFSVKPAKKTIAPMDFEKFVLKGNIPEGIEPDIYRGKVLVSSENQFEILVRLVVTSAERSST